MAYDLQKWQRIEISLRRVLSMFEPAMWTVFLVIALEVVLKLFFGE
jgi:hypothetical protein